MVLFSSVFGVQVKAFYPYGHFSSGSFQYLFEEGNEEVFWESVATEGRMKVDDENDEIDRHGGEVEQAMQHSCYDDLIHNELNFLMVKILI